MGCWGLILSLRLLRKMRNPPPLTVPNVQELVPVWQRQETVFLKLLRYSLPLYGIAAVCTIVVYWVENLFSLWEITVFLFFLGVEVCWLYSYVAYLRTMLARAPDGIQEEGTIS
jgi:hypothetical protein